MIRFWSRRLLRIFTIGAFHPLAVGSFALFGVAAPSFSALSPEKEIWSRVEGPTVGVSESIGKHSAGCLRGGVPLEKRGEGFRLVAPERGHHYGSTELVGFIRRWAKARQEVFPSAPALAISDLSLPRGGPSLVAHASHQTGLDVDIWYHSEEDSSGRPRSVVRYPEREVDPIRFTRSEVELLKSAAIHPEVDRIFVHYAVKKAVCDSLSGDPKEKAWIRKIRPWYGHDSHFHLRMKCPAGSLGCREQAPLPSGDGCGKALDAWWSERVRKEEALAAAWAKSGRHPDWKMPLLPANCERVLVERSTHDEQDKVEHPGASFAHSGRLPRSPSKSAVSE